MGIIFDILGSFIVRAAIVGILLQLMITMSDALYRYTERVALNDDIISVAHVISSDLKNVGYKTYKGFYTVTSSSSNTDVRFAVDSNSTTGIIVYIRYYLSSAYSAPYSHLKSINRDSIYGSTTVNTLEVARNVSRFRFNFYDASGVSTTITTAGVIRSVNVNIEMDSKDKLVGVIDKASNVTAQKVSWEQQFFPENL
ncbi:MAG: hypothetical protein Q8L88_16550 [Bacteroidota bacterium]|nr:hypothetical protein [Bacteroidota bacterium]